jgi:hypothetical protein
MINQCINENGEKKDQLKELLKSMKAVEPKKMEEVPALEESSGNTHSSSYEELSPT